MAGSNTVWWWLRHAPVRDGEGRIYGHTDLEIEPPSDEGVRSLAAALPDNAVWMTSQLRRSHQTAELMVPYHPGAGRPIEEPDFSEMYFGAWENVLRKDIPADEEAAFWDEFVVKGPPAGESFGAVIERVVGAVHRHNHRYEGQDVVVVGHSGSIRAALTLGAGITPQATMAFTLDPLKLTRIDHAPDGEQGHWSIAMVNGTASL